MFPQKWCVFFWPLLNWNKWCPPPSLPMWNRWCRPPPIKIGYIDPPPIKIISIPPSNLNYITTCIPYLDCLNIKLTSLPFLVPNECGIVFIMYFLIAPNPNKMRINSGKKFICTCVDSLLSIADHCRLIANPCLPGKEWISWQTFLEIFIIKFTVYFHSISVIFTSILIGNLERKWTDQCWWR